MDTSVLLSMLKRPAARADVVLDTDTYNEIDDQFALSYLLCSGDQLSVQAVYAAPFWNENSSGPLDGMEKSWEEILHLLTLMGREEMKKRVFKGSGSYLPDEKTPVLSPAAADLADRAMNYSSENPLYVVAIGAITNVASAILLRPEIIERMVVVWLGGHAHHWPDNREFNLHQDIAAARVIFGCGVPLVQLPCMGVVEHFATTGPELHHWLDGKNPLCDYLVRHTVEAAESYAKGKPWSRTIWDVTAVAWLLDEKFMSDRLVPSPIPEYDGHYAFDPGRHPIRYVTHINRDVLFEDLFRKLAGFQEEQK